MNGSGQSYWVSFDPNDFGVGGGSHPNLHPLSFSGLWEWSAVDPDTIYFLDGGQFGRYSISTNTATNLGRPQSGEALTYHVAVAGQDNWVCSAAGDGGQDTYTKLFCLNPSDPSQNKLIDILNHTINGTSQTDPNWPTSASGQTIGVHSIFGSAGGSWLGVVFHRASWGSNGTAVLDLATNTWSLVIEDRYASGHTALGSGRFVNGSGSTNGVDSRGALTRNPSNLMDTSQYRFIMQPAVTEGWYDAEHSSWFNASTNPGAPILFSRYNITTPPTPLLWYGEIVMAATDGSNTVWRFAHNHNGSGSFYGEAFAQVSNDGRWVLFSSYWDGELGPSNGDFGVGTRIDTFIVQLS